MPNWRIGCDPKDGRQRRELQNWLRRLVDALGGRVLGFNVSVAHVWADEEHLLEKQMAAHARGLATLTSAA